MNNDGALLVVATEDGWMEVDGGSAQLVANPLQLVVVMEENSDDAPLAATAVVGGGDATGQAVGRKDALSRPSMGMVEVIRLEVPMTVEEDEFLHREKTPKMAAAAWALVVAATGYGLTSTAAGWETLKV